MLSANETREGVKAWLAKNRRFHLHFAPTSASWLSLVERFFAEITTKRIIEDYVHGEGSKVVALMLNSGRVDAQLP